MLERLFHHKIEKNHLKQCFICIFYVFLLILTGLFTPMALAAETPVSTAQPKEEAVTMPKEAVLPPPPAEIISLNTVLIAEVDSTITVTLDGETLDSTQVHRSDKGNLYVNAMPIFTALENDFEYDDVSKALIVRRSQDNVVMELYTDTGIVKANGKALGKLKHFGEIADGKFLLTPNAIAVLSGTSVKFDKDSKQFSFKLDPRLKVATGFEVFVNERALGHLNPAPRSIGPVLILPLQAIAEELGHDVQVNDTEGEVTVRRAQDSASLTLNLSTGLIKLRGTPYGISKDVTYIDPVNLLLPVSAIEALTGTHVTVGGGSNRIDIDLDERLTNAIKPSVKVSDAAKNTPFTPEMLSFHIGPDTINQVNADFRVGSFNGRIRYEAPDLPTSAAEVEPSWLSLDFAHVNGIRGSIGDYSADFRELDGVGLRRIRGVAAVKETVKGRWALAAGVPTKDAVQISDDQSRLTFGGFAAGARFSSKKGWEAGVAYKSTSLTDDQVAVLSAISGRLGRKKDTRLNWEARADLGYFNGPARENSIDARGSLTARVDVTQAITIDGFAQYDGAEFLRTDLDNEAQDRAISNIINENNGLGDDSSSTPDVRRRGQDQLSVGASLRVAPRKDVGPLKNPAASLRVQHNRTGYLIGKEDAVTLNSIGASAATSLGNTGVSLSLDATAYEQSFNNPSDETERGWQFSGRLYRRFDLGTVRAQYQIDDTDRSESRQMAALTVNATPVNLPLPKDAALSVGPSASLVWTQEDTSLRGGVIANLSSGTILGEKNRFEASFGILQSVSQTRGSATDKYLTLSIARQLQLGKNMALGLSYRNNLNGDQRIGLQLDGRFDFNEKRKYRTTKSGRGVLKGRAFLDKNRDGIRQDDEPGVNGAIIRVKSTRLQLRSDRAGFFTIQNIKEGIYDVLIDGRSLPLGFAMSEDVSNRVTIKDGHITDIPLPVVQRGQIRGFTYIDENNDGEFTTGEERVEGTKLTLTPKSGNSEPITVWATSFGQFAFDDLSAEDYEISVAESHKMGIQASAPITVKLADMDDLMARLRIPVVRSTQKNRERVVQSDVDPPQTLKIEKIKPRLPALPTPGDNKPITGYDRITQNTMSPLSKEGAP